MGKLKNFVLLYVQFKLNVKFETCRVFFMFGTSHQNFGLSISSRDISRSIDCIHVIVLFKLSLLIFACTDLFQERDKTPNSIFMITRNCDHYKN